MVAESTRIATFNIGLDRKGPGLLLRDLLRGEDPQILAAQAVITTVKPDILLLTNFDYDIGLHALTTFADGLNQRGVAYPHLFAFAPNSGFASGADLNGDGWFGGAQDAHGYGDFAGQGGMALISRFPIDPQQAQDFSKMLWQDFPGANLPEKMSDIQRLSSVGHWDVPVILPNGTTLHLLAYHATTPAFDGPEDFNRLRNHDENLFWVRYINGALPWTPPDENFVILGDANLDPMDGQGRPQALSQLLNHPKINDPKPQSNGAVAASKSQGGINLSHNGNPAFDTADWRDTDGPGNLRVDYVLPSSDLRLSDAGVFWPASEEPLFDLLKDRDPKASWHGLVWVDITW